MSDLFSPDRWCVLSFAEKRDALAEALRSALADFDAVKEVVIEAGSIGREYDLTALVETDVGRLRTPLWSHARATLFCDSSVHAANREPLAPGYAVNRAAESLRSRLVVRFTLESRGLTVALTPRPGVERVWTAERSMLRNRTAVSREDRMKDSSDVDLRELLADSYVGPSMRLVGDDGTTFLLPEATEVEGPLISLCHACNSWFQDAHTACPKCQAVTDVVVAARPPRRIG